jgi:hypothetical protein
VQDSILAVGVPRATSQDFLSDLCWSPRREVVQPEGLCAEKGVHFLGLCRLRGMRDCWLELLQEL